MDQPQNLKERSGITGTVIVRAHPTGTLDAYAAFVKQGKIVEAQNLIKAGDVRVIQKNIIVDSGNYGIDIIVQYLISAYAGSFSFPLGIAWGEIGTGSTTPTLGDTALTTPTNRATVAYAYDSGFSVAAVQFFFPDATLTNGTYYEFGTFIGGTSVIGSGNMFNHALFSTAYSKSSGVDTTVEVDISIAN
jgi:hypothetical protein